MIDIEIKFRNGDAVHTDVDDDTAAEFIKTNVSLIMAKEEVVGTQLIGNVFFKAEDVLYYRINEKGSETVEEKND